MASAASFTSFAAKEPIFQFTNSFRSAPSSPCPLVSISRRRETKLFSTILRKSLALSIAPVNGESGFGARPLLAKSEPFMCQVGYAVAESPVEVDEEGLDIASLGIDVSIVAALAKRGIYKLFPIQRAVLEPAMQGRDMIGRAKTGTGKTLAFGLPILDKIIRFNAENGRGRNPLALVMAPTRELACQVEKEFRMTAPRLSTTCCYGGTPIHNQMRLLRNGVDVVVGTPGRIIDLLERGALDLSQVQFLVLDEADQMLAVGFEEAVEEILQQLPKQRQSMMFSATMPPFIRSLTRKYLNNPVTIDLVGEDDQKLAEGISLYSIASNSMGKASILGPLINEHAKGGKSIVFTRTKRDANDLAYAMSTKYRCKALHGDISQSQRERTLSGFKDGRFNILVATDVASRGLDIPNVDLVVHYELPNTSEIFVHRSGRTGRAGKKGSAILMYTSKQTRDVKLIEREIGCRFTELPKIQGDSDMLDAMNGGGGSMDRRYGEGSSRYGEGSSRYGEGSSRSGGQGGSRFGRSSSSGYGRSSGSSSGRMGGHGESRTGRSGGQGGSRYGGGGYGRSSGSSSNGRGGYGSNSGGYGRSSGSSSSRRGGYGGEYGSGRSGQSRDRFDGFKDFAGSKGSKSDFWDFAGPKDSIHDSEDWNF